MRKLNPHVYDEIYNPKLNRREQVAFDAFGALNREREYINTPIGTRPINIKLSAIKEYHNTMSSPLAFEYLKLFIQSLDDVFIEHSMEQLKNGR